MDEGGCGSSGVWNICSYIPLDECGSLWLFQFITGVTFKWYYVLWFIISLMVCIGLWTKLRIYKVPPDPVRWSC